jgi:hypothetical protein
MKQRKSLYNHERGKVGKHENRSWNDGMMELLNAGIMEYWEIGIMEAIPKPPSEIENQSHFTGQANVK